MANNYASKYSKYVDDVFWKESILTGATNNKVDFTGVNEVTVYNIDAMNMNDYSRTGTSRYGTPQELGDNTQTFAVTKDRSFTGTIDRGNDQDQMNTKDAGTRLKIQMQSVVTPEVDQYVLREWAYGAGKVVGGAAPTKSTIVGLIADAVTCLNNSLVPKKGRTLFLTETCYSYLAQATEFSTLDKVGAKALCDYDVGRVLGVAVRSVPDSFMPTGVYFILQHKEACPFIKKLDEYKIHKDPPGINGNLIEGRVRYGAWVLGKKCDGVYVYAGSSYVQSAPTFSASGGTVTVTAAGATIYYTTDGTDPRYSDTRALITSGGTFTLSSTATVKAYGYTAAKFPSPVSSQSITV